MPWSSWVNAEVYDRFVRERELYAWLNRRLTADASLEDAEHVLDLGCGTGATTLACLSRMPAGSRITGLDRSLSMVALARRQIVDPRADFNAGSASDAGTLDGVFDRVVCNAAFWQLDPPEHVFEALSGRCRPGARFLFNVPAARVAGEASPLHPFQVSLTRLIERKTGGMLPHLTVLDRNRVHEAAAAHGFDLVRERRLVYRTRQEELMELMAIPAMIGPLTPTLTWPERHDLLRRARGLSEGSMPVEVPWHFFLFERQPPAPARTSSGPS